MLPFGRTDLERLFPETIWKKAENLVAGGAVLEAEVERDGKSVSGRIRGERRTPFLTRVRIANGRGGRVRISSTCTCLVYTECEHAAETLLGILDRSAAAEPIRPSPMMPNTRPRSRRSGATGVYIHVPTRRWRRLFR